MQFLASTANCRTGIGKPLTGKKQIEGESADKSRAKYIQLAVGIILSLVALFFAFRNASWSELSAIFSKASWGYLPGMLTAKFVAVLVKDWRWRVELSAMRPGPYKRVFHAVGLGYFANILLPFRVGELARVGLLRRHNPQVEWGELLATIAAERILDALAIAILVLAVISGIESEAWVWKSTALLLAATFSVSIVAMLSPLHRAIEKLLPEKGVLGIVRKIVVALSLGSAVMRNPKALMISVILTFASWGAESLVCFWAAKAVGIPLSFSVCLVVIFLLSFGLLVPSAPGQVGTHQALVVLIMAPFAVSELHALSISLLLQSTAFLCLGSIGAFVLLSESSAATLLRRKPGSAS